MGYKIDYEKFIELQLSMEKMLANLSTNISNLTTLSRYMYESGAITCKAANAVKAYIKDVHLSMVAPCINQAIELLYVMESLYFSEMYNIDKGNASIIQEDYLSALEEKLDWFKEQVNTIITRVETAAKGVEDILELTTKDTEDMSFYLAGQKAIVTKLREDFRTYEDEKLKEAKATQEVINTIANQINKYQSDNMEITKYNGEYQIQPLQNTIPRDVEKLYTSLDYNEQRIAGAFETKNEVINSYIMKKEGEAKMTKAYAAGIEVASLFSPLAKGMNWFTKAMLGVSLYDNVNEVYEGAQLLDFAEARYVEGKVKDIIPFKEGSALDKIYDGVSGFSHLYTSTYLMTSMYYNYIGGNLTTGAVYLNMGEDIVTGKISDTITLLTGYDGIGADLAAMLITDKIPGAVPVLDGISVKAVDGVTYGDDIITTGMVNETSYGKSSGNYKSTADFLVNVEYRNGNYYTDKATIDEIGRIEASGEDFSLLNKRIMSSRASTEGGTSIVYNYSDDLGTKYIIHEVTDANGYIIHRDFDAVRISSGQLINKGY